MELKSKKIFMLKILGMLTFVITIIANILANALPINHLNTKQVSDMFPNLFAPAPITFSIWGVIYTLLIIFVIYQYGVFKGDKEKTNLVVSKLGVPFIISNLANAIWIFCWHYLNLPLSMVLTIIIFVSIAYIFEKIKKIELTGKEKFFVKIPFSVYFGWITIATIANVTALLVQLKFDGFGLSQDIWTVIITLVGLVIGSITTIKSKDIAYGLVILWAYIGIYLQHTSVTGWNNQYPLVVSAIMIYIIIMLIELCYVEYLKLKKGNVKNAGNKES